MAKMIGDLLAILGLGLLCFLFWQQRKQSEVAKYHIKKKCDELNLQLVSVAFHGHKLRDNSGKWHWHTHYYFEFSALGDDCYQGRLKMVGFYPVNFHLPPHRIPD
jgi:hypothetical protein